MKDIAVFGAGGFGREVACLINLINKEKRTWNFIGFFDDNPDLKGTKNEYGEVIGGIKDLNSWQKPLSIAVGIGNPGVVKKVIGNIVNERIDFPNLFAPTTLFLDDAGISFGKGNIIASRCLFSCNVKIGDFNIFNSYITIGHDVTIGSYNSLMPGVRISGEVTIGDENFFGCDSVVLQQLKIGSQTVIGANSVVVMKTKNGFTYIGNPAKKMKLV